MSSSGIFGDHMNNHERLFPDPYGSSFPSSVSSFPSSSSSNRTYDVARNDAEKFIARVPLGPEFIDHPEAVDVTVNNQTVKLKAS